MYRTGDVGRWRADGAIEFLGRNDQQVKIRGFRVEPGEIEAQLAKHAEVTEALVLAREDVPGDKRLVAYLVPREGVAMTVEELRAHLKSTLPEYMVPSAFVVLERMPLTPNGKLDRRALPTPELDAYVSRDYQAPQGAVEEIVAAIWQELLGVERVGRNDNFFELGGHSLLGMKLAVKLAAQFDASMSVAAIFRCPTVRELADLLQARLPTGLEELGFENPEFDEGTEFMEGIVGIYEGRDHGANSGIGRLDGR
jgi:acyl carrier protein